MFCSCQQVSNPTQNAANNSSKQRLRPQLKKLLSELNLDNIGTAPSIVIVEEGIIGDRQFGNACSINLDNLCSCIYWSSSIKDKKPFFLWYNDITKDSIPLFITDSIQFEWGKESYGKIVDFINRENDDVSKGKRDCNETSTRTILNTIIHTSPKLDVNLQQYYNVGDNLECIDDKFLEIYKLVTKRKVLEKQESGVRPQEPDDQ